MPRDLVTPVCPVALPVWTAGSAAARLLLLMCVLLAVGPALGQSAAGPDALYRAGYEAYSRGDLSTAHDKFARLVQAAPQMAVAHEAYGEVLLAEGKTTGARDQLELAHKLQPASPTISIARGEVWRLLRDPKRAAEAFIEATEAGAVFSPQEVRDEAEVFDASGHAERAEEVLRAAVQPRISGGLPLTPSETALLQDALGSMLAKRGSMEEAASHFTAALTAQPQFTPAHEHLGLLAMAAHQPEAAIPELREAARLDPANVEYATQLGRALTEAGEDAEAILVLRHAVKLAAAATQSRSGSAVKSLQLDPTLLDARYALALALQAAGEPQQALPLLADYAAARPGESDALTNYALALVQTGDAKRAVSLYTEALARGPDNPTLREDLGVAFLQQSDLDHAIEQFTRGLALQPENPHLHYDLGLAYKLKDNLPAAIPEFERAEALDPTLPDPPYTLGVIRMQQGDFPAAARQLEQAVALRPANGAAWAVLGNVYKENGNNARAVEALRKAITLQPEQPSNHISLAAILAQGGDTAGAAAERRQAAELSRSAVSRQRASFALKSGRALLDQGKLKEAEAQLRTATEADPADPSAHQALAEALTREGRSAEAAVERRQAAAQASTSDARTP